LIAGALFAAVVLAATLPSQADEPKKDKDPPKADAPKADQPQVFPDKGIVTVKAPKDMKVAINGAPAAPGTYATNLPPGARQPVEIRGEFTRDGKPVVVIHRVELQAGTHTIIDLAPSGAGETPMGKDKAATKHTVEMVDNEFKAKNLTVEVGDTVVWVNKGKNKHSATADQKDDPNAFDTGALEPDTTSKAIEFKKEGKVPYHCEAHPDMKATVTVKAKANP